MSEAISDGSMVVVNETTMDEGFTTIKLCTEKDKFKCIHCPYTVESTTKAAIKRHLTTKHPKGNNAQLPTVGVKRSAGIVEDGEENPEDKRPKMDDDFEDDLGLTEESLSTIPQSTQKDKTNDETNLDEMLAELESGEIVRNIEPSEETYNALLSLNESTFNETNEYGDKESDKTVIDADEKDEEADETDTILLRTKIASLKTELLHKDVVITDKNNEIDALTKDLEETNESFDKLRQDLSNKDKLNESIIAQNEALKIEIATKDSKLSRCTEVVRNARDQMRVLKAENEEIKLKKGNEPNSSKDTLKKKYDEELKQKDMKIKKAENDKKILANSVTLLELQISKLKNDTSVKYDRASTVSKESINKIKTLEEENANLKNNLSLMQKDINDKNSKIAQLDTMNTRLFTHNNHLTELCSKSKLFEAPMEIDSEVEEVPSFGESDGHKKNKMNKKCYFFEKGKCTKSDCVYIHPSRVCKKHNEGNCELGINCSDSHRRLICKHWLRGNCTKGESCPQRHSDQKKSSPVKAQTDIRKKDQNRSMSGNTYVIENLVNAVKEGFKSQNDFLANTLKMNPTNGQQKQIAPGFSANAGHAYAVPPPPYPGPSLPPMSQMNHLQQGQGHLQQGQVLQGHTHQVQAQVHHPPSHSLLQPQYPQITPQMMYPFQLNGNMFQNM